MQTQSSKKTPLNAPLKSAFVAAIDQQASIRANSPNERISKIIRACKAELNKLPRRFARHVIVEPSAKLSAVRSWEGALCEMIIPQRGRMDGVGRVAIVLLKILIVAYLEAKDGRLSINLTDWQKAAEQDPSTPALKEAIRGHEREFSNALVSLFRDKSRRPRSPFTDLCRPCFEVLADPSNAIAHEMFGKHLQLAKLGRALREKVEFLKKGGCKDG